MNGRIYLSGAMQHAVDADLGAAWRVESARRLRELNFDPLDITALDVQYNLEYSKDIKCSVSDHMSNDALLQTKANIRKHFVAADLALITSFTDAMVVRYDEGVRRGAGTISECQHAFNLDIPIFLVNEYKAISQVPGWLYALTTQTFNTFEDLYVYLEALPPGILKRDVYGNRRSGNHYLCSLCGTVEEKHKTHYVSKVSPLYCKKCVETVKTTHESHYDRYQFFVEYLERDAKDETSSTLKSALPTIVPLPPKPGTVDWVMWKSHELAKQELNNFRKVKDK